MQFAAPFTGARFAERQQTTETAIGCAVGRIDKQTSATVKIQPAAVDDAHARRTASVPGAHQSRQTVAIHDADRRQAQHGGGGQEFLRRGCTPQEAEMARHLQLDIALIGKAHAKAPWMNQAMGPVDDHWPSPKRNSQ